MNGNIIFYKLNTSSIINDRGVLRPNIYNLQYNYIFWQGNGGHAKETVVFEKTKCKSSLKIRYM